MVFVFILYEISFIYSLILTLIIEASFVSVGEYPEYLSSDINYPECGVRHVSTRHIIYFNGKCFKNDYPNQTFVDIGKISTDRVEDRVIFGRNASLGDAPWAVYLSYKTGPSEYNFCSGVLVTFQWVLTAAHCYDKKPRTTVTANAGSNQRKGLEQILLNKRKWFRHPNYLNRTNPENKIIYDISLVKLQRKFTRIQDKNIYLINTICLPIRYQVNVEEDRATFFGYGIKNDVGNFAKYLQRGELNLAPFNECSIFLICVVYSGFDPRTCVGDSGGGLVRFIDKYESRAILIGTLIGGYPAKAGCSEGIEKDFFTTVSFHIDWILDTIQNN